MKKIVLLLTGLVAACGWADGRTANREWVQRNFAPTGLVARVEALEAGGGEESDPVFGAWRTGLSVALGEDAEAEVDESVAIGYGAVASEYGAVQIGEGSNDSEMTLKFFDWVVVDNDGRVPRERLANAILPSYHSTAGDNLPLDEDGICLFGSDARASSLPVVTLSKGKLATPYLKADASSLANGANTFSLNYAGKKVSFDGGKTWLVFPEAVLDEGETSGTDTLVSAGGLAGRLDSALVRIGQSSAARYPGAVGVGFSAKANEEGSVALGSFSVANAENAVQIGEGTNASAGTLQFRGWTLVGANGKIPAERITPSAVLAALQELDATQLAALKGLLGLGD